ncbi:type II toxin-antitoxin system VapC family toxin [Spirosoma foliorum]|uniref:Type II toxin-antitoxin system VapC family toxin n=1 Tax=Spirosoma foliorum TaxID=2710596 RepID=A0A7G5GRD7_9BACT|nr:type II toxin-antitoxin system VapC family toxin [Spirosoma foliorum]QMW01429.1 type II toxin-antitoxin system VapC family toxin [Spirosoma foliorum]
MNVLLDTQAVIWYVTDESLLTPKARTVINGADLAYVSAVSFYEIAIKLAIGKDAGIKRSLPDIIKLVLKSGFLWLPMAANHIETYSSVPLLDNHKDPFDRMILATALADNLIIISSDHNFPLYSDLVTTIW